MEVRWLEDFVALARTRHFSRAAELQHVSQPTFSRRIKLLEDAMGTTLIDRQTLPLSLTPAGEVFLDMCERITRDVRDTRDHIASLEAEATARISVGATQGLLSHFYADWATEAAVSDHLTLNLKATNWVGEDFLTALDNGDCDLVLCYWHRDLPWHSRLDEERYQWLKLADEQLIPFSVGREDGSPRFALPGSHEQPVPVIDYHARGFMASAIIAHLGRTQPQAQLRSLNENSQSASVKALVKQGFGLGWLPSRMSEKSAQFGRLVRAGDERWEVPIEIRLMRLRDTRSDDILNLWNRLDAQYA
ncbi:LysR family transcriptional regulator [Marinobacter caseinilyticus]|uniref:LysR family transcriptional regulator n=1 Tax=Marinobacter caseinilyticus TaxID=2692195 RepID=UPI0014099E36|nr:LysR family transcriptional regulator [Marinobacter caseinilyticus]